METHRKVCQLYRTLHYIKNTEFSFYSYLVKGNKVIPVAPNHLEPGIIKYKGEIDAEITKICHAAGLNYTVYMFADNRMLLILPNGMGGFLYPNKETLLKSLSLEP